MPEKDPVIYLRGVCAPEMKSILQFMYLGKATFYQDRMNEFLNVARSLEIKEISKDVDQDVPDSLNDQEYDTNIDNSYEEKTLVSPSNVEREIKHKSDNVISHSNEAGKFPCNMCDKLYPNKGNLDRHIKSAHEGMKYPCNECRYEATTGQNLKTHIQAVHEGMKFPCDLCDFKATRKNHLYTHKKNKH